MNPEKSPAFNYRNKRDMSALMGMVGPLIFILVVAGCFHGFVWNAVSANLAINLGIIIAATFGVFLIFERLTDVQKDFRIIERFGYEAKNGTHMRTLLEQPWLKSRYVRHYLSHIAHTDGTLSTQLEHSSIEDELHALQADYDSRLELPQFLVGFMIAMGLLGTFIGLLRTLTGISGMLDHMGGSGADVQKEFMQLVVELRKPLAGMGIAFSASMFGLVTSLMLAIMMTNLRRYISRVISLARNVMHELVVLTRESTGAPASFGFDLGPSPYADGPSGRGGGIDPAVAGRFDVMTKKIELLLEAFESNTATTRQLNDLIGFGPRMKELSERTLEELKGISAKNNEQHRLLQSLADQISESRDVAIGSARHLNDIKENFTKMSKTTGLFELVATGIGSQTALMQTLVDETRRSQQGLAIINKSIMDNKTRQ